MAPSLEQFIECQVCVVTVDGRIFVGALKGFDQLTNVVLYNCSERVFRKGSAFEELPLGIYMLRGDNIALVGEMDVEVDRTLEGLEAEPLKPVVY
ncbi:putative U6 snRNA-associated Sm-like protein LSm8 [Babesia divergens]|uniref:U6 snRNA-associated Sm-like protein LSm8 n=1 Tax=Babesia divergens TaxID=32595 RepID=A0AAD9GCU6_BABDI|nr:putative U6 snRNA-associated Sm-like protein LSm8 [Babesia divergens]